MARSQALPAAAAIGADLFFAPFLAMSWWLIFRSTPADLARQAAIEDEGAFVVTLLALAVIAYTSFVIFTALNQKRHDPFFDAVLTLAGAPLSWLTLQTLMAFRYADLYYRNDGKKGYVAPIDFPECSRPGPWEFVYVSAVIGMTAQVSDTDVRTTRMRRAVTGHAVVAFFYNTVLIAMAVNAAMSAGA